MTLLADPLSSDTKKDKKRDKKKRRAEALERERDALRARAGYAPTPPSPGDGAAAPAVLAPASPPKANRAGKWLQPIAHGLENDRMLIATKSSFLVAINCVMLSLTAHALYRDPELGSLWPALIPLALTNLLSLAFAIFSAQGREKPTALDTLWSKADGEYEPALESMLNDKRQIVGALTDELHLHGAALAECRRHLRSAYHVLLGGLVLSAVTFGLCVVLATRT